MEKFIPSTKRRIINGTFTNNHRNRINERYLRFLNRFDKIIMNRFIGPNTDTTRNRYMGDRSVNVGKSALFNETAVTDLRFT